MKTANHIYHAGVITTGIALFIIGLIFFLTFQVIKPFFGIFATAGVLAIFLKPIYEKFLTHTGKKGLSSLLTILTLFLFIIIPLGLLISNLLSEVLEISKILQDNPGWMTLFQSQVENQLGVMQIPVNINDINIDGQIYQSLTFLIRSLGAVTLRSGAILLNLFFTLITIYFFLAKQNEITDYVKNVNLFPKQFSDLITSRTIEIVNGTVRGYLLVIVLQLVVGVVGFLLTQTTAALLLGSLYGVSSLLPLVGGFLVWIPVVVWQLITGNVAAAIFLTAWFLLSSFVVENIIAPKIVGQKTKLHQLAIMFSVFGGIQYFGLIGMVLGPVVVALFFVAISILKEITTNKLTLPGKAN